ERRVRRPGPRAVRGRFGHRRAASAPRCRQRDVDHCRHPDPERLRAGPPSDLARLGSMTHTLVLLRHGHSDWNAKNLFTGWVDVGLTEKGLNEAVRAGELLAEHDLLPDVLHTSVLKRAIATAESAVGACDRQWIQVLRSWRLN